MIKKYCDHCRKENSIERDVQHIEIKFEWGMAAMCGGPNFENIDMDLCKKCLAKFTVDLQKVLKKDEFPKTHLYATLGKPKGGE